MSTSREYNTTRKAAGLPLVRFDLRKLSDEDILDLRHAYEALYEISDIAPGDRRGYWAIARGHGYDEDLCHQDTEIFLPWHRAYVYVFEKMLSAALQRKREDDGVLTLPYWDWTVFDPSTDDENGVPRVLSDETYLDTTTNTTKPNPLASARSMWRVRDVAPQQPFTRRYVTAAFRPGIAGFARRIENFMTQPRFSNFMTFQSSFDGNPHGSVHVRIGGSGDPDTPGSAGDLSSVVSAGYDPIFWLHHCMVDKVWFDWQQLHGNGTVPQRILGRGVYSVDNQPWTVEDTLDTEGLFDYTYGVAPLGGSPPPPPPEGLEAALPQTLTVDIGRLARGSEAALLHLHGVTPPINSYELRIYVNPPAEPGAETPTTAEAGYADSIFFFGHGRCTGAPGHCDPNAEERGIFDRRGGHPLSPRNYIADLTEVLNNTASGSQIQLSFLLLDSLGNSVPTSEIDVGSLSITER